MTSIDAYIFRTTLAAFVLILVTLTGVIWVTQALRGIDLMTSQGQTILVFLGITGLAIPLLVLIIAPIALVLAVGHTLNRLSTDSELIVMNAAGMAPWQVFRPFFYVTCVVSLLVAFISAYLAPEGMRRLKRWDMEITADVVANILQPRRFTSIDEGGLTIRVGDKQAGGRLSNIFIDDRRDPKERLSIMADRGTVLKNEKGTFIILEDGILHRFETGQRDPALVAFDRFAFDMSKYSNMTRNISYSVRERYLWELASPSADEISAGTANSMRAEFHDRLTAPLYPFVFVLVTFAFLGAPRTTRQSRSFSVINAILAVTGIRMIGFASAVAATTSPWAPPAQYTLLAIIMAICTVVISRSIVIDSPAIVMETVTRLFDRMTASIRGGPAEASS